MAAKLISNISSFADGVKGDFARLQAGHAVGVGELMSRGLNEVAQNGFVRAGGGDVERLGNGKSSAKYPEGPGLNVKSADREVWFGPSKGHPDGHIAVFPGRAVFALGKVVSRRGRLPRDLAGLALKSTPSGSIRKESGTVALLGNGYSTIEVIAEAGGGLRARFWPNRRNELVWLGLQYGRGVSKQTTIMLNDGTTVKASDTKLGQRQIIMRGIQETKFLYNKVVKGEIDKYLKRRK